MESNIPIMKRVWNLVRVAFFMLRKGISKGKLMMDLNIILKRRRKITGKYTSDHYNGGRREYEFSCSNTPNNSFFSRQNRHNHNNHAHYFFACAHAPPTKEDNEVVAKAVLEMLNNEVMVEASPALPGFDRSPIVPVRQLRVTDSPFPLRDVDPDDHRVDVAAEEFINKFYKELKKEA